MPAKTQEPQRKSPVTVEQKPDGTFQFHGGKGGFQITEQKNKALEPYGKRIWNYGIVLEVLPETKASALNQQIGNARFVRNNYLSTRIAYYKEQKQTLSVAQYKKDYLPELKKQHEFLQLSDKFSLENACRNVDDAYKRFFEGKGGFPRYASSRKPNGNSYTTNYTTHNIELVMKDGLPYLKLPKIGYLRFVLPKGKRMEDILPAGAVIKAATVSRIDKNSRYQVSLRIETVIDKPIFPAVIHAADILSVDLGLKVFGVFGNLESSESIQNPRWIKIHARRLRRFQQALSRKQYDKKTHTGSKNWEKARLRVAKEQRKTANQRKDFHHKLSRVIADSCSAFICEDLAVKNMMKNRHLSKSIASIGWSSFLTMVQYKMERAGKYFRKISRWMPSSQRCHQCGYINKDVKDLTVRKWICPKCKTLHDRDENAQKNICMEGIRLLTADGILVTF